MPGHRSDARRDRSDRPATGGPGEPALADIAVILVSHEDGRWLAGDLESVCHQSRQPAEIRIVDRGSRDVFTRQVLARLDRPRVRVLTAPTGSWARAVNSAIEGSLSPYLVVTESGHRLAPTFLEEAGDRLDRSEDLDVVSCGVQTAGAAAEVWTPPVLTLPALLAQGGVGGVLMFRRRLWSSLGGFDDSVGEAAAVDFLLAALVSGSRAEAIPEALLQCDRCSGLLQHLASRSGLRAEGFRTLLHKHRHALEAVGPDLLLTGAQFLDSQRARAAALLEQKGALQRELVQVGAEIDQRARALADGNARYPDFGDLGRPLPLSGLWGVDRGTPVDRVYIEEFLHRHRQDIRGHVLEVKDSGYTTRYGGAQVTARDVIDIDPDNLAATIVADLAVAESVASDQFDCVLLVQTLQYIYDLRSAVAHVHRILTPQGVVLCTVPALGRVDFEVGIDRDYWRFTEASLRTLFAEWFPLDKVDVEVFGNIQASVAFLHGLAAHELSAAELGPVDPFFPTLLAVRAVKHDPLAALRPHDTRQIVRSTSGSTP